MEGIRDSLRRAFGKDALVQNLVWAAVWFAANWIVGQALTWSLADYVVAGVISLLLLAAALLAYRNRRAVANPAASPPALSEGRTGPTGHLELKPLRADLEVPEEVIRAEWDATCEPVSESLSSAFGRGVILSIENKEGEERDLRCIVTAPDGARYRSVRRIEGFRVGPSSSDSFHWPGEFEPKPQAPWTPGYYPYAWSGDTGDIVDDRSEVLAQRFFHVDENEIITCHRAVAARGASPERWKATYELRRDPKLGPGATLSIRSTGQKFGHFICQVTNPAGAVATSAPRTGGYIIPAIARTEATVHYPGQFRGAIPLMPPGEYIVEWYGQTGIRPDDARVFLARLTFDLPHGYRFG